MPAWYHSRRKRSCYHLATNSGHLRFGCPRVAGSWVHPKSLLCPNCAHGMQFCHFWLFWHNLFSVSYGGGMGA